MRPFRHYCSVTEFDSSSSPTATIVIPAHNERSTIPHLLRALKPMTGSDDGIETIVVCNGCTDDTAAVARAADGTAIVVEIAQASKRAALDEGDRIATGSVRIYVDSDVVITREAIRRLIFAVSGEEPRAAGPTRHLDLVRASWIVRSYYRVWMDLPQVRDGLFGRGVVAMSSSGHHLVQSLPHIMSDDLAISEVFSPAQRAVLPDAIVAIKGPRTVRDLLRRRIRVATGNAQADAQHLRSSAARTSLGDLRSLAMARPRRIIDIVVFFGVTVVARLGARQRISSGDFTTWLRDDSSRS